MFKTIVLLSLFYAHLSYANEDLHGHLTHVFPKKVNELIKQKDSSVKSVKKIFGDPKLIEGNIHYYQIDKIKYDLVIKYKDNIVSEIQYTNTDPKFNFKYFEKFYKSSLFLNDLQSHSGNSYSLSNKDKRITLIFKNTSSKKLTQVSIKK